MATDFKQSIDFPEITGFRAPLAREGEKPVLTLTVSKAYRGDTVDITARCSGTDGTFTTFTSSDYSQVVYQENAKRVTQKRIDTVAALNITDELIEKVKAHAIEYYTERAALKATRGY